MIPLRDNHRVSIFPFMTNALIMINSAIFFHMFSLNMDDLLLFIEQFAVFPMQISQGNLLPSIVTSMFLHAGFLHIISNMLFLHIFGPSLEERFGHGKFFLFYALCGIISVIGQVLSNPASPYPMLGASGAISGLLGAYIFLFPEHKVEILFPAFWFMGTTAVPAGIMLLYWFLTQYFFGIDALSAPDQGGIAYFAHIAGFVGGLILAPIFSLLSAKPRINQLAVE